MALHCTVVLLFLLVLLHCTVAQAQRYRIRAIDLQALRDIHATLTGSDFFSTWDFSSPDPCSTFAGVTCSSAGRITSLTLGTGLSDSPGLSGSLDVPSISALTELTQFILFPGSVSGPIPPQLGSLPNLRVISLTKNRLIGPIPPAIFSLPNLHTLDLSYNMLTGSIPPGLSTLNRLKVLVLASNRMYGRLPKYFPGQLLHLDLKNNRFTGQLPYRMPLSLRYLSLSFNELVGPVNGLESLSELVYLDLSMNEFSGVIPAPLFRPSLSSMQLQRNNFTGTLPIEITSTSSLLSSWYGPESIVDLSHNYITGQLSSVLAGVESVFLNSNCLTGTVPIEYLKSVVSGRTKTLYLQHNYLSGFPSGSDWPESATVCVSYNCMMPPVGLTMACPASAGEQLYRPKDQCLMFNNGSHIIG